MFEQNGHEGNPVSRGEKRVIAWDVKNYKIKARLFIWNPLLQLITHYSSFPLVEASQLHPFKY